jgi:ATP-dependent DNA helicase 2 subunit 1
MADKQRDWRREENDEDDEGEQELDETVSCLDRIQLEKAVI